MHPERRLFGREPELAKITAWIGHTPIVLILGKGGIGKSHLLEAVRRDHQGHLFEATPPPSVYDFFHVADFSAAAIEAGVIAQLPLSARAHFPPYHEARAELAKRRQGGDGFLQQQQAVRKQFIDCYNAAAAAASQPFVLVFDTVEQAVNLSDGATIQLVIANENPSDGGAAWLRETLPRLERTTTLLAGRHETLFSQKVALYAQLKAQTAVEIIDLDDFPLSPSALRDLQIAVEQRCLSRNDKLADQLRKIRSADPSEVRAAYDPQHDLSPAIINTYRVISGGEPFWIDVLLTCELLQIEGDTLDLLCNAFDGVRPDQPNEDSLYLWERLSAQPAHAVELGNAERDALREKFILALTQWGGGPKEQVKPDQIAPGDFAQYSLLLSWLSVARKGMTRELLEMIATKENVTLTDPEAIFNNLVSQMITKLRPDPLSDNQQIFLHDELYRALDQLGQEQPSSGASETDRKVSGYLYLWYEQQIDHALTTIAQGREQQRRRPNSGAAAQLRTREAHEQQLQIDQLTYCYQVDPAQLGRYDYNQRAYLAIVLREAGFGVAMRQEDLRQLHRFFEGSVPSDVETECAARWLLRAVHSEDRDEVKRLVGPFEAAYLAKDLSSPEARFAHLALAQAYAISLNDSEQRKKALGLLDALIATFPPTPEHPAPDERSGPAKDRNWQNFLISEAYYYRGYLYRQAYRLAEAEADYREALRWQPEFARALRGQILNNRAFVHSEQGEVDEAATIAREGLIANQLYSSRYAVGLSYNTLGRIAIREGKPRLAEERAEAAWQIFDQEVDSERGRQLNRGVRAECSRKQAEEREDQPWQQDELIEQAIMRYREAICALYELKPAPDQVVQLLDRPASELDDLLTQIGGEHEQAWFTKISSGERLREAWQGLGCSYRSHGQILIGRDERDAAAPQFERARRALRIAAAIAERDEQHELIRMDIYEDIAVTFVNEDRAEPEAEDWLNKAEKVASSAYKLRPQGPMPSLAQPLRGIWRELGQVELQRMLLALIRYDFDEQRQPRSPEAKKTSKITADWLAAAEPLVRMVTYLLHYNSYPMLNRARNLTLRELRLHRTEEELDRLNRKIDEILERYGSNPSVDSFIAEILRDARR